MEQRQHFGPMLDGRLIPAFVDGPVELTVDEDPDVAGNQDIVLLSAAEAHASSGEAKFTHRLAHFAQTV